MFHAGFLRGLLCDREDGGDMILRNVSSLAKDYMALCPWKQISELLRRFAEVKYHNSDSESTLTQLLQQAQ
jgi:hypothetical protein